MYSLTWVTYCPDSYPLVFLHLLVFSRITCQCMSVPTHCFYDACKTSLTDHFHRLTIRLYQLIYLGPKWWRIQDHSNDIVVGVMKMGNIVPRAGIEPISLAFQVSVLNISPPRLSDVTTLTMLFVHVAHYLRGQCRPLHLPHPGIVSLLMLVSWVMKMGNNVPRVGLEPTSLCPPFHHIGSLTSLLYPRPPVYAALLPQRSVQTTTIRCQFTWLIWYSDISSEWVYLLIDKMPVYLTDLVQRYQHTVYLPHHNSSAQWQCGWLSSDPTSLLWWRHLYGGDTHYTVTANTQYSHNNTRTVHTFWYLKSNCTVRWFLSSGH